MINLRHIFLILICLFFESETTGQENHYTFDMTEILSNMTKNWSIGNGIEEPYFEVIVNEGMNLNNYTLEIMNSKITVYGDTINTGQVIKRFTFISDLIIEPNTLNNEQPLIPELKMFPNPAEKRVFFSANYIDRIFIYNMSGIFVKKIIVKNKTLALSLNELSSGTYIIQVIFDNNKGVYKKLIKK